MESNWLRIFVVATCVLLTPPVVSAIPLNDFYSFGTDAEDSLLGRNDDGSSPAITLTPAFKFFGTIFDTIFVSIT